MSDGGTLGILGIAGSLRRGSFNAATLHAARELAPSGMTIESFDAAPGARRGSADLHQSS
jgi:NAD(P)H-dependent FMN reductase